MVLRLHRDERGSMSLVSVFAVLLLTILLGMVLNASRQVDTKVRLQNVADASTYSGGVVLARGMNSLAFTNHLLSDVFALTAFLREARDRHAQSLTPEILAAWSNIGPVLSQADFPKFSALGDAIPEKVQREQEMINRYSDWTASIAELVLPVFDGEILQQERIPQYQRAVVMGTPLQAQIAAAEIAWRNSPQATPLEPNRGPIAALLWRSSVVAVGGDAEAFSTTLPVVDPQGPFSTPEIVQAARQRRDSLARRYLTAWNNQYMSPFDNEAKMSQFGRLWRGFTCAQLQHLLTVEYPDRNLPMMIRPLPENTTSGTISVTNNVVVESDYMFVGVAYWPRLSETMPGIFRNPLAFDQQAFAQGTLFIPTRRIVRWSSGDAVGSLWFYNGEEVGRQDRPTRWDLWNQNWNFQIVPASAASIPQILSQDPSRTGLPTVAQRRFQPPPLNEMSIQQMDAVNSH